MSSVVDSQKWRFWPVLCLAFFYPVNSALLAAAIPLYYYRIGVYVELIGFLAAATTITYCFSPIIFIKISNRIGRKKGIFAAMAGTGLAQATFYITLNPIAFFIARLVEGLMMGLFWSNLQASISDNALFDHDKYMSKYNFSWNFGNVCGFLIGTLMLFFIDDLKIVFYVAPAFVFTNIAIVLLFFQEAQKISNGGTNAERKKQGESENPQKRKPKSMNELKYFIPVAIPILYVSAFAIAKAMVTFLYPIKSEILGFETYTVYFLSFLSLIAQLISTSSVSKFSIKNMVRITLVSLVGVAVVLYIFSVTNNYFAFIALFLATGFFGGALYSAGQKIFLLLNVKENTSKYASMLESVIGAVYLTTPIVAGFIAAIDINLAFLIIAVCYIPLLIGTIIYGKSIKEE